ncbi:MAG: pyrroloquinoline quinone-dependent dehydrogenase [Acidobacteriota bacterium]|nr:pyrroloquinoline quinone-dependent dehydrogenase [Acidobacteriota bacterium]
MTRSQRRLATSTLMPALLVLASATAWAQHGVGDGNWPSYGGDYGSTKYTALDQIDRDNVADLEVIWGWDSPDNAELAERHRILWPGPYKVTPLMVGGTLYVSTSFGQVAAIDGETGEQKWVFDTEDWRASRPTNLGYNHRGVGYWTDGEQARILMPTNQAYLWAIDAHTGEPVGGFGEGGKVDLTEGLGRPVQRRIYSVISAPMIIGDTVVVGSSIFDGPTRKEMPPGHVRGFDVRTGEQKWIFHTIPQGDEPGVETWEDDSWTYSGNTNVWSLMSGDPELGYVYLPTGTPTNDWYGGHRLGDNLYAESLVCLDADTGEKVWHFQFVHHGLWDYDVPAAPNLVDITVDGKEIKAVAQITKQGFIYVFDRATGEHVWPIEERPVPQTDVPGERTSPTQPFPTRPAPYEHQGFESDDMLISFTPELHEAAKAIRDKWVAGPLFTPPSLQGTLLLPGWGGGANWYGAAVDPETSTIYIPSFTGPMVVKLVEPDGARSNFRYVRGMSGIESFFLQGPEGLPLTRPPYGRMTAIDLNTGEHAWMRPLGDGPRQQVMEITGEDPGPLGGPPAAGPLLTKTLLFLAQGGAPGLTGGDGGGEVSVLRAHDKKTGEVIHEIELDASPSGTPMSYAIGGRQYIALAVTGTEEGEGETGIIALALPDVAPREAGP